ncbi:MAG TPA: ATPase, T2SS/T4P/T4SS family, partial [Vicinamibacteria bacterium]|nr:ATPase, T2SS/T4P/T4SS family [Vicinamibacteria bacterium]
QVSEIGDAETARLAFDLAQRGPLVLSTLPTSDAPSTVAHLLSMGIDPYLLATTVHVVVAQRLVRRVCGRCKVDVTAEVPAQTLVDIGFQPEEVETFKVLKGKGCATCNGSGYKGRVGLYEVMEMTEGIRDLIMVGATPVEIKRKALEEGMLTLRMSGLEKIRNGVTTVEEVLRETVLCPGAGMPRALPRAFPQEPVPVSARAEGSRAVPLPDPGLEDRGRPPLHRADSPHSASAPESLAVQLATANAEVETLRQRLLELSCSDILVVQLANAKAEIETLREHLFELYSYRTAYERLQGELSRRPVKDH